MPDVSADEDVDIEDEGDPSDAFWKTEGNYSAHALDKRASVLEKPG
jgi:hypothetical protein